MEQDIIKNTEIVEDMPDFEEITAEMPCEGEESVTECTADAENAIVSEENTEESADTEEKPQGDTQKETEKEEKDEKPNLPYGFSFNPLVMAIKPFYEKAMAEDELFAKEVREKESRKEKPKSLAECADYIMGEAYKYAKAHQQGGFGLAGFPDEEMPNLIKHYYDEDDIKIHKFNDAKPVVSTTPAKSAKKTAEKPKPVKNVLDITKAIVSATKDDTGKRREKKKDSLKAGFVPMERPATLKDAKKGSREQAKSVETIDMFADFFASED